MSMLSGIYLVSVFQNPLRPSIPEIFLCETLRLRMWSKQLFCGAWNGLLF